jgi:predicted nuclease with TOPRIM domain
MERSDENSQRFRGVAAQPLTRALIVTTIVALGVAVYALVVNLGLQSELAGRQVEIETLQGRVDQLTADVSAEADREAELGAELSAVSSVLLTQADEMEAMRTRIAELESLTSPLGDIVEFLNATFPDLNL